MTTPLRFTLPGEWWRVPLDDDDTVARSARAMVKTLYKGDETAQLRAEVRQLVAEAASEAKDAGAQMFYFATQVVPGVPVPLTLATYFPELPPRLSAMAGPRASADSLAAWLRETRPESTVTTWATETLGFARDLLLDPAEDEGNPPTLRSDYWIARGDSDTAVMSFSAPLLWEETAEALLTLMDAVVDTLEWPDTSAE